MAPLRVRPGREGAALKTPGAALKTPGAARTPRRARGEYELERLTAPALRRQIEGGSGTVIVPFGSIEYQDGHLPLGADALLADRVGQEVSRRLGAALAPTMRVGSAERHAELVGTLSIPAEILTDVAVAIAQSLGASGFSLIAFVSTHGGNAEPLRAAVARFNERRADARAIAPRGDVGPHPGRHSGQWLTSVMLSLHPELVDLPAAGAAVRAELQSADAERGAAHFERFVSAIVEEIRQQS